MEGSKLVSSVNWTGSTVEAAVVTETKEVLTDAVKLGYIKVLIDANVDTLRKHKDVYTVYNDTDLGSIITRMEQNIIQLRKMEYSLTD